MVVCYKPRLVNIQFGKIARPTRPCGLVSLIPTRPDPLPAGGDGGPNFFRYLSQKYVILNFKYVLNQ